MQTFLPSQSFAESLACLDNKRLGKQRVEAMQILQALEINSTSRWRNHPAVKMWANYIPALTLYHDLAIATWKARGFKNNMIYRQTGKDEIIFPHWLTEEFCSRHRSNLLRKDYEFYIKYGWTEPIDLEYIWPV